MRLALAMVLTLIACGSDNTQPPAVEPAPAPVAADQAAPELPAVDIGDVLATVGEGKIGSNDFIAAASRQVPDDGKVLSGDEKRVVLEELVSEEALWQEAVKRGFYRDPKVRKMMVNLLLREEVYAKVRAGDFTQEQMQAYFDDHREEFVVPEKVQVKRILLAIGDSRTEVEAVALGTKLRADIKARPDSFKELAAEHSDDPYKRRGGDLGYLSKEGKPGIDPAVVEMAFTLNMNQVSEPFIAGGGVNLVMVVNKRERVERSFDQMKGSVLRKLKNDKYKELQESYVLQTRRNYEIAVDASKLATLQVTPGRPDVDNPNPGEAAHDEGHE